MYRPALVELVARLIGQLSRLRLDALVARFNAELDARVQPEPNSRQRQELLQLFDGMKELQLTVSPTFPCPCVVSGSSK